MQEVVKICLKHGPLNIEEAHKEKNNSKRGYLFRCNQCKLEKDRRWKELNREQHRASAGNARKESRKLYREGLTDIQPKANVWAKKDRENDPEKYKKMSFDYRKKHGAYKVTQDITSYFGLTHDEYINLFTMQNNLCAICNEKEIRKSRTEGQTCRLGVDHCHKCEENGIKGIKNVRGLLCHGCNTGIGKFKDNIELLENAIKYLKKHQCN